MTSFRNWILPVLALGAASRLSADDLVYSATAITTNTLVEVHGYEYGSEIDLAGASRQLTEFVLGYFGDFSASNKNAGLTLRLYSNNGIHQTYPSFAVLAPGTLLYQSPVLHLQPGYHLLDLTLPKVSVPSEISWTVELSGVGHSAGNQVGLLLANSPTVGGQTVTGDFGSLPDYWVKDFKPQDNPWTLYELTSGDKAFFYAEVFAVPEPAPWALAAGGAGALWLARRRRAGR